MESFWKKSDLARLAIVTFILTVVIGGRFGYAEAAAVRTAFFFVSLTLFWLAKWCFVNWVKDEPDTWYFWEGLAITAGISLFTVISFIAAVVP